MFLCPVDSYEYIKYVPYTNKTKDLDKYKVEYKINTRVEIHTRTATTLSLEPTAEVNGTLRRLNRRLGIRYHLERPQKRATRL